MKQKFLVVLLFVVLAGLAGCTTDMGQYPDKYWVTASKANVYKKADNFSDAVTTIKFGDELFGKAEKLRYATPKDWLEVMAGGQHGFVELKNIGDQAKTDKMRELMDSVKDRQLEATGTTSKKFRIRMAPAKDAELIEYSKEPQGVEIFSRTVNSYEEKGERRKETWYLARLADGRVGYISSLNITLTPPGELGQYTQSRRTVSWYLLRTKEDGETGKVGRDYLATYAGTAISPDADFDRVEMYNFDIKKDAYSTSFAKSGLKGRLPVTIIDNGDGNKTIQIRTIAKGKEGKFLVQEYSYPQPIKVVREYEE